MYTREEYEAKRQARYDRLIAAAERAEKESSASLDQARKMASFIPFGQPILVGHHSEKRDRNYRGRIENKYRKGFDLMNKAQELKSRAASVDANDAIYSDDPDATEKLADKVAELEKNQAEMKRINAALRKGADFETLEMSEEHRAELLSIARHQAYYNPLTRGFPPYKLTNNNAKIKAAKQRAAVVEKKQSMKDEDFEKYGVKIEGRPSENRIRLYFPSRVDKETYNTLGRYGFRFARTIGAFSAYYNSNATYYIKTQLENWKAE